MTQAGYGPRARGSLDQVAAAAVVAAIHSGRRSGVLHLTREDVSKRLYFRTGSVILAGSDQPEDRLGQALVRSGLVRQADLERALGLVEAKDRMIGEALVEMGLLRPDQVRIEAARRAKQIVASVLDWDSGEFAFEEQDERLEGELLSEIDVPEALIEWARQARPDVVRRLLDDGRAVLHRPERSPASLASLQLTASEQWVLEQANGAASAAEIAARSSRGADAALRSACGLLLAGMLLARAPQAQPNATYAYVAPGGAVGAGTGLWAALEAERADAGGTLGLARQLPQTLGRYVVESAIGRGSMGAVLLARDPAIDRRVAVKLIQTSVQLTPPEWEKYKERFYREARAAGKLLHQGIVAIFDVGHTVEGIPFIVMEYVEGRTLAALAEAREIPLEEALRLAGECLEALEYAHSQGVIHRDLKPANIMITADGRPKVMDFGVAHVVGSQMTQADEILGSPHFMAPEQLGKGKVDQRTDLFAFGVVLYWMLTGQLPFTGDSFAAIAQAILSERPVTPKELKRSVPRALGNIVLRCLEKDPARRFPSARELRAELRSVELQSRPVRWNVVAGLGLLFAGIAAALLYFASPRDSPPEAAQGARPSPPARARAEPGASPAAPAAAREDPERRFRESLPLTFAARHGHRIGGCSGSLLLGATAVEYRSSEHERWRFPFAGIRALERKDARSLKLETADRDYNFSLERPLTDADWARYRRLAKK